LVLGHMPSPMSVRPVYPMFGYSVNTRPPSSEFSRIFPARAVISAIMAGGD
jgi:hypothetical protein